MQPGAIVLVIMLPGVRLLVPTVTGATLTGATLPAAILLVPMLQDLIGPAVRKPSRLGAILSVYIITVTRGELR